MSARFTLTLALLACLAAIPLSAPPAGAHVNSPDIYLEEKAGPYSLLVIVHMPPAIPGTAEVQVRLQDGAGGAGESAIAVFVRDVPPEGEEHAIGWGAAEASKDDPATFVREVPLMVFGLWNFDVRVTGAKGEGTLRVPVPARVAAPGDMDYRLGGLLAALLLFLLVSGFRIGVALGRDAHRPAGAPTAPLELRRGRRWGVIGAVGFATMIAVLGFLWQRQFLAARRLSRPPLSPHLQVVAPATPDNPARFELAVLDRWGKPPADPVPDHGKRMHLVVLQLPEMTRFFHLHPTMTAPGRFEFGLSPGGPGRYALFGDLLFEGGEGETVSTEFSMAQGESPTVRIAGDDPDDSFAIAPRFGGALGKTVFESAGGVTFHWRRARPNPPRTGAFEKITFELRDGSGALLPGGLKLYMGMLGHLLIVREGAAVFAHVHPMGTLGGRMSMPGMKHDMAAMHAHENPSEVSFPYAFPSPGTYRLFVQVMVAERVHTGVFDTRVE